MPFSRQLLHSLLWLISVAVTYMLKTTTRRSSLLALQGREKRDNLTIHFCPGVLKCFRNIWTSISPWFFSPPHSLILPSNLWLRVDFHATFYRQGGCNSCQKTPAAYNTNRECTNICLHVGVCTGMLWVFFARNCLYEVALSIVWPCLPGVMLIAVKFNGTVNFVLPPYNKLQILNQECWDYVSYNSLNQAILKGANSWRLETQFLLH